MMNVNLGMEIFFLLFVLYWYLFAKLMNAILESPRLQPAHWLGVGALNALILFFAWAVYPCIQLSGGVIMLLMFVEVFMFYKDRSADVMLCALACCIHIIAVFMMTLGMICLSTGHIPYEILRNGALFSWCSIISFVLLDLLILAALKFVPLSKIKLLRQHKEQQWFIIAWITVSALFLLYMEKLLHSPAYPADLAGMQVAVSFALLIGLYSVLFCFIKVGSFLGYKEKTAQLEQVIQQEQKYRNFMVRDALASYEVNVTQNLFLQDFGQESNNWGDAACYMDMLVVMSQNIIYSEDIAEFVRTHGRANILRLFEKGERELVAEYRRLLETGEYIWVRSIVNLVQDTETGDVKAFICVKNIDHEKKSQLELQYQAERDPLTGLYNRNTTRKLIEEYLAFGQSQDESALFMIDVDAFKKINDHFGHLYGDAVLCELSDKLTRIFRKDDIVGRIGGDEFIIFLKDGATLQTVEEKAMEICKAFHVAYQGNNEYKYSISGSVGISFFPRDGNTFKELYAHADIALYLAKGKGKNGYKIYDGSSFPAYTSQRSEIQAWGNVAQKGFRANRIEYVFKMLYQSENPVAAIHSVLELVTRHFSFERGYIFETSKDGKTTSNTFEWCAEGITPEIDNLQMLPIETVATAHSSFQRSGTFIIKNLDSLRPIERAILEPQGIKSMFQFGIFDKSRLLGFIGFDNCRSESVPTDNEVDEMKTICNILATFFVKQYIDEVSEKDLLARQEVMNHLENYIYVINTETFELLYMNEKIRSLLEQSENGTACYRFFSRKIGAMRRLPTARAYSIWGETHGF